MSSTREICDVLEEYSERLKETLCRCRRDQAALSDAYRRCGRRARDAHQQLKLTEEHHSQLMQFFTSSKQQLDSELSDTRQKLYDALQHKEELVATAAELRRQLDLKQHDLLAVANLEIESLKEEIQALNEQKQELENIHKCKDDMLAKYEEELEKVKSQLRNLEDENNKISSQLCKTEGEGKEKVVHIEHLEVTLQQKDKQIADMQDELVKYKETTTQKVEELSANIRQKEKELDDNAETIARLMSDVKATCDARARSELAMQRLKHDHQLERDAMIESERKLLKQVEQLECSVRERLQSKIEGMQGTIDNIQKELTGRTAPPVPRPPPEHDDNALMCPPTKVTSLLN
ncbi:unnamed protein product [Diatraea saccharalis]|uniref:Uncharacterized protein n=1 Tax=Diatraea saccharalis TaxID=40085 RepID=A0A9N9WEC1_9NEOP|nr:unnamed protein product [Diatraea saccharalis]